MSEKRKVQVINEINRRVVDEKDLPEDAVYIASSNEEVRNVNTKS